MEIKRPCVLCKNFELHNQYCNVLEESKERYKLRYCNYFLYVESLEKDNKIADLFFSKPSQKTQDK